MFKKMIMVGLLCGSTFVAASDMTEGDIIINYSKLCATVLATEVLGRKLGQYPMGKRGLVITTGANIASGLGVCAAALYDNTPLVIALGTSVLVTNRACGIREANNPSQIMKNVHSGEDFVVVSDEVIANKLSTACTLACLAATAGIYAGRQGYMPIARS